MKLKKPTKEMWDFVIGYNQKISEWYKEQGTLNKELSEVNKSIIMATSSFATALQSLQEQKEKLSKKLEERCPDSSIEFARRFGDNQMNYTFNEGYKDK